MTTAVEQIESATGLTWEAFEKSPEYKHLTKRQRIFFAYLCATGDSVAATRMAFDVEPKNLRSLAWHTERNPYVKAALDLWKNRSERETFLDELKAEIAAGEEGSVARSRNMALYARLKFGLDTPDESEVSGKKSPAGQAGLQFKVGDPIIVDGVKRRVTAVDENGHATDVTDEAVE
jgi:hypothetical protein